jgi:hypothetical protein
MYGNIRRYAAYLERLAQFLRQTYGLAPVALAPARRGFYGETWRLTAEAASSPGGDGGGGGGVYFLKLDYSAWHQGQYEASFPLLDYLRGQGVACVSQVVKTVTGQLSARFEGAVAGLFVWIEGENIEDEVSKHAEYKILAGIYALPPPPLPRAALTPHRADFFYDQWARLAAQPESAALCALLESRRAVLAHRAGRLAWFAKQTRGDAAGFVTTHGDAGGNMLAEGDTFVLVDWDSPLLAPPERDAWFCLHLPWAMEAFQEALDAQGVPYRLRQERLGFYCYHSFFQYLTEYLETYFEIGHRGGDMAAALEDYFGCWIEEELAYADRLE